jgi:hypothetical protein
LFDEVVFTVNVLSLVRAQATDGKLSIGCLGSTITTGQIVDDQSSNLVTRDVLDAVFDNLVDLGTCVASYSVSI